MVSRFTTISKLARFRPPTSKAAQPKQAIGRAQLGSRVLPFKNTHLLSWSGKLQSEVVPRTEECPEPSKESQQKTGHRMSLLDSVNRKAGSCKSLFRE
jgi:hypothetical protein